MNYLLENIIQLENKLNFCKLNGIKNINIPCKGIIKKEFLNSTVEFIEENYKEFNVVFHYSLYHQYFRNKKNSSKEFLNFINKLKYNGNSKILLVSGSNKRKYFEVVNVLNELKKEDDFKMKFGTAYNPYLYKYYNLSQERERYEKKVSSGLVNSIWLQFGTDVQLLDSEIKYLKENIEFKKLKFYGSLLIPSKQFIARFKFRPWKGVYISDHYLYSLEKFYNFTKILINFYIENNITPVIETDFCSIEKLDYINSLFRN